MRQLTLGFEVNKVCSYGTDTNDCDVRGKRDLQLSLTQILSFGKDENVFKIAPFPWEFQLLAKKPRKQQQKKAQQINFRETLKKYFLKWQLQFRHDVSPQGGAGNTARDRWLQTCPGISKS